VSLFRLVLSALLCAAHAGMWWLCADATSVRVWHAGSLALATPFLIFIATDVELACGRLFAARAWLAPWIPGHHRGALYFALHVGAATLSAVSNARRFEQGVTWVGGTVAMQCLLVGLLLCAWTLPPIGLLGSWIDEWRRRVAACTAVLAFVIALTAIGFVLETSLGSLALYSIVEDVIDQGAARGRLTENAIPSAWTLGALAALGALLCFPRALRGMLELTRRFDYGSGRA
jgi:hypothetical protein